MSSSLPRKLRVVSGVVLFAYVASHLGNLAIGLVSLEAMDRWRHPLQWPWQILPGLLVLYGALALHLVLGLQALWARRTLRMSGFDATQLVLALTLPPLLVLHVLGTRVAWTIGDQNPSYAWLMLIYWKSSPWSGMRQLMVVLVAWVHGCMGMYAWMHLRPWWDRWRGALYPVAFLVPVLALLGFVEAGKEALALASDPAWVERLRAATRPLDAAGMDVIAEAQTTFIAVFALALVAVLVGRGVARRGELEPVQVSYLGGPTVRAPAGLSLLEVSRVCEVPHASLCGGRGRCGACRVRVVDGERWLAPPGPVERETRDRLGLDDGVRLACQCVPTGSPLTIERLADPFEAPTSLRLDLAEGGRRLDAVVVAARVRGAERQAASHPVHDVLLALERRLGALRDALEGAGARVTPVAGEGLVAVLPGHVRAACSAQAVLDAVAPLVARKPDSHAAADGLEVRVVLHRGPVLVSDTPGGDPVLAGSTVDGALGLLAADLPADALVVSTAVGEGLVLPPGAAVVAPGGPDGSGVTSTPELAEAVAR